ncbi:MAG: helix-turn-helix domain-containing protein [Actinobacteria bacterium]|nr:helix-turn-helix domain-containing protein [Actinomycetota bacterium]
MSPQLQARRAPRHDEVDVEGQWSILPIADSLFERKSSTTTRLGMPFVVRDLDDLILGAERMTGAVSSWASRFWRIDVSSTETGITYTSPPRPVREEVQKLRDEIARRTRLTREQIARALGVDRRSLSAWAKGEATPSEEKLARLQVLADVVRDIDATGPGRATEVLLSRSGSQDLLDHIAAGRLTDARAWQSLQGVAPSVTVTHRRSTKRPLHQNALDAYLKGELRPFGRAATIRPESDYEQDLAGADHLMPDEPVRRTRRGYR